MDTSGLTALVCIAVIILETSVGVLASVYVVTIILIDFFKNNNMRTGNKIRMALALSNVCFSIITSASVFSGFFWPEISRTTSANYIFYSFILYCISSCSWLTAILSFFYFIKIVHVKTKCFIWARTNISSIVSWVILGAEIASFWSFFSIYFVIVPLPTSYNTSVFCNTSNNTSVSTYSAVTVNELKNRFICTVIFVTFVPFLVVLLTTITTAVVLKQHKLKMEKTLGPSSNVKLRTYKSAIFRMLRLLFFFTVFYVVMLIYYLPVFLELSPGFWVSLIIMSTFTPVQSILIVFGNPKLKSGWKKLATCIRICKL